MLRQGPVSAFLHGVVEYVAGALFIAAPFLFGFDSEAATAVSDRRRRRRARRDREQRPSDRARRRRCRCRSTPLLDVITAGFLIAAPFLFGFQDETAPTAFMIVLGVVHLLLTIATRFLPPREQVQPGRQAS